MRRLVIITLLVLAAAVGVCAYAQHRVDSFTRRARHLRTEAIEAIDEGDVQRAEVRLVELASFLKENEDVLESFCEHEDLHELKGQLIDAQASIEFGIEDDFYQAIYRFGEMLDHLSDVEELRLTNVL